MRRSAIVLLSTTILASVGWLPRQAASAPAHGRFGLSFYGPGVGFGIGFHGYRYYPRHYQPYRYRFYGGYPYAYRPHLYVRSYPTVGYLRAHPSSQGYHAGSGAIRLVVDAKQAQVYVDSAYAGTVDDFDGTFQKLYLQPGEHEIEIRLEGHQSFTQRFLISPSETQKLHHQMVPLSESEMNRQATDRASKSEQETAEPRRPESRRSPQGEGGSPLAATLVAGQFGVLQLHVQPAEGEIHIDGEPWGALTATEEIAIHLPAGMHRVDLFRGGTTVFSTEIEIRPRSTTPLNIRFSR